MHALHNVTQSIASFGFVAAFLFGLLGSVHCVGMCGPLVSLYASQPVPQASAAIHRRLLLYNVGRVVVYVDLGILLGGAGWLFSIYPWASGAVGLLAGGFVTATGIHFLCSGSGATWLDRALMRPTRVLVSLWRKLAGLARSPGIIVLGGLHGLLPCPLLYVMFSSAVAVQSPLQAGVLLLSFGLGTVPTMWGLGVAAHYLTPGKRAAVQRAFGGLALLWGAVLIAHGIERLSNIP